MSQLAHNFIEPDVTSDAADPSVAIRPVPRITVQAFCESADIQAAFLEAAEERRMTKAHTTVQMGGTRAAVEYYENAPTPNVIVIESLNRGAELLQELEQLAEVCDATTKVIVIGHANDVLLYRELIRRGVSEYIVAPVKAMELIVAISGLYDDPGADPVGRTIAFVGARGGAGSSTIAHNVAWMVSTVLESDVVLADLDLGFGTAGLDFNQDPVQGIGDAIYQSERLDEQLLDRLLFNCTDRLSLFSAPATLEREYDVDRATIDNIFDIVRTTVPCVIADIPHQWTGWVRSALLSADEIVITATPDLASLRNTKNLVEVLKAGRKHDAFPRLVINQAGVPKRPEIPAQDFVTALEIEPAAVIPFDPQLFGTAANNGQMIAEMGAKPEIVETFAEIARIVTGRQPERVEKERGLASLLSKINLGRKGR